MVEMWVVYTVGTVSALVGACLGMILLACCVAASRADDEHEG